MKRSRQLSILQQLPESLNTPEFREVWEEFKELRRIKKAPLTQYAEKLFFKQLSKYPVEVAISMVEQSIKMGWSGIWEVKETSLEKEDEDRKVFRGRF